jgi:hypothetical protein
MKLYREKSTDRLNSSKKKNNITPFSAILINDIWNNILNYFYNCEFIILY